jgi:hypothetical protein
MKKKLVAGLAVTALAVVAGGAAFAYWTSSGSGAGSASTGTQGSLTLTQTSTVSNLRPSGAAQTILGTVTNSNAGASAYIDTITPSIDLANTTFQSGCSAADYTLTPHTVGADVADGATGVNFGSIKFNNDPLNPQNGCQGQALVLSFSSN